MLLIYHLHWLPSVFRLLGFFLFTQCLSMLHLWALSRSPQVHLIYCVTNLFLFVPDVIKPPKSQATSSICVKMIWHLSDSNCLLNLPCPESSSLASIVVSSRVILWFISMACSEAAGLLQCHNQIYHFYSLMWVFTGWTVSWCKTFHTCIVFGIFLVPVIWPAYLSLIEQYLAHSAHLSWG